MEFKDKYRPDKLEDVVGQAAVVKVLQGKVAKKKVPHVVLMTGPPGTGKTTILRILAKAVGCVSKGSLVELNAAADRGMETARDIKDRQGYGGLRGGNKAWILDECHQFTVPAQNVLLKVLEDPKPWAYYFLATTDPGKLIKTLRSRCTEFHLAAVPDSEIDKLLRRIVKQEKLTVPFSVAQKIVDVADGCARNAVVLLEKVSTMTKEKEMLNAVQSTNAERQSIDLCRALLNPKSSWKDIAAILKGVDEEPETMRRMVNGYMQSVILSQKDVKGFMYRRAQLVLQCFRDPFYNEGKSLLTLCCSEVCSASVR